MDAIFHEDFINIAAAVVLLSAAGICGDTCLADVGGPPYLIPQPTQEKIGVRSRLEPTCE